MNVIKGIPIAFLALEFFLGAVCFAVEVYFEICTLFIRYYSYHYLESNAREYLVRTRLVYTTVTGFPCIILPVVIISMFLTRRTSSFRALFMLFSIIGCTLYIASGAVTLSSANLTWVPYAATQAFGALCITTGVIYLAHVAYEILAGRDDDID